METDKCWLQFFFFKYFSSLQERNILLKIIHFPLSYLSRSFTSCQSFPPEYSQSARENKLLLSISQELPTVQIRVSPACNCRKNLNATGMWGIHEVIDRKVICVNYWVVVS